MRRRLSIVTMLSFALTLIGTAPALLAQEATPAPSSPLPVTDGTPAATSDGITLYAGSLENPRGMTWDSDGTLYVALAGSGGTTMTQSDSPQNQQYGPYFAGNTASVVRVAIEENVIQQGCPVAVAGGLPSTRGMSGHEQGPAAVAFLDQQLYVLQDSGSSAKTAFPDKPNGVYSVSPDGSVALVADIMTWHDQNPVENIPYDLTEESETFAMLAGDGFLWVLEANSGQVLKVTTDGQITRIADLSEGHPVPTGFALAPDGGVYVGFLTPAPYVDGSSKVVKVTEDGSVTDVWTGLTTVTALAVGADDTLYALEMATGNTDQPPFTSPGTGRIVRQTGPDALAEVVVGLDFPIAMALGPDDALYVSFPAFGSDTQLGGILRVDLSRQQPMTVSPTITNESICEVETPVPGTPVPMAATPEASPIAMDGTPRSNAGTANDGGKAATGAQAVEIKNFAFTPSELSIPSGTTITWTNTDSVAHTVTAADGSFGSGNLNPNESFSFRFDTAGTFTYNCSYHPNMQGTITVT